MSAPGFSMTELRREQDEMSHIERVLVQGDLSKLTPEQRVTYYNRTCESLGLNPLTRPFDYMMLNGKLQLYARKDCTEQLRSLRRISVDIVSREVVEGCYIVTSRASMPDGRHDESIGAVPIENLKGENRANAMMKCETKAKRRVTLSICGLGMMDETEVEAVPGAVIQTTPAAPQLVAKTPEPPHTADGEVIEAHKPGASPLQEQTMRDFEASIAAAKDLDALKRVWGQVKAAQKADFLTLTHVAKLTDAKDARKKALAEPPKPEPDASLDEPGAEAWGMNNGEPEPGA